MHDFMKFHHNCDAYMVVQKERKSTFLTAFEYREKEDRSLFAAQFFIAIVSECLCHKYPVQLPDICIGYRGKSKPERPGKPFR